MFTSSRSSATGIGAACAVELAKRGWRTVINFTKSEAEAQQTARECEARWRGAAGARADVSQDADCRRMAAAALEKWGRIDGLINNAGTTKVVFNHANLEALSGGGFPEDLCSECDRCVPDDPRRRAHPCGSKGCRLHCEHFFPRGRR